MRSALPSQAHFSIRCSCFDSTGYMDQVAANHGAANLDVNRRIKRALDPTGIIAPGKSGIRI